MFAASTTASNRIWFDPIGPIAQKLAGRASKWKANEVSIQRAKLTAHDWQALATLRKHPSMLRKVYESDELSKQFFKWCLRNRCDAEIFARFPEKVKLLMDCQLESRIALHGGLRIVGKDLKIKLEGREISLLDETAIHTFRGNYRLTLPQILAIFKKNIEVPQTIQYSPDGFINWNTQELGYFCPEKNDYVRVDLSRDDYYKRFPSLNVCYTQKELEKRLNCKLDPSRPVLALCAGRGTDHVEIRDSHSFIEIYLPQDDGTFSLVVVAGKQPVENPINDWQGFKMFLSTVPGFISIHDYMVYNKRRQERRVGFSLDGEKFQKLKEILRKDLKASQSHQLPFQSVGLNCGEWAYSTAKQVCPEEMQQLFPEGNPFTEDILGLETNEGIKSVLSIVRFFPEILQPFLFYIFSTLFGFHRSMKVNNKRYSLSTNPLFVKERKVHLPAKFVQTIIKKNA